MAYMADGCRRTRDDAYFSLDRDNIGSGELIVGPGHPIAWPRTSTELPRPPEELGARIGFGASDNDKFN